MTERQILRFTVHVTCDVDADAFRALPDWPGTADEPPEDGVTALLATAVADRGTPFDAAAEALIAHLRATAPTLDFDNVGAGISWSMGDTYDRRADPDAEPF